MRYIKKPNEVSAITIARLALYLRTLEQIEDDRGGVISSKALAEQLSVSAVQIRKDLNYFGDFGKQGQGYQICMLKTILRKILNAHRTWPVVLVGVGQLGRALIGSEQLANEGFEIAAVFDSDRQKIGTQVGTHTVLHVNHLPLTAESLGCRIGIICTTASSAQRVADRMINAGINSILNYAPASLVVPDTVRVQNIDPVICLRQMTYHLTSRLAFGALAPSQNGTKTKNDEQNTHVFAPALATAQPSHRNTATSALSITEQASVR